MPEILHVPTIQIVTNIVAILVHTKLLKRFGKEHKSYHEFILNYMNYPKYY